MESIDKDVGKLENKTENLEEDVKKLELSTAELNFIIDARLSVISNSIENLFERVTFLEKEEEEEEEAEEEEAEVPVVINEEIAETEIVPAPKPDIVSFKIRIPGVI